jgi:hypothetical protein
MAPLASIFSISAVQLTFSFEIAAMQLTPTVKMGVLQVRPTSKIVTMRLPSSQHLQSAMNFQVNFEIAKIQPVGGAPRQHPNDSVSAEANCGRFAFVCGGGIATRS